MLVDGNFNAVVVAGSALAERTGAAHEHATAVAQLAVEGLDHARTGLADAVSSGWQYLRVGTPGIGKVARVAVVAAGQRRGSACQSRASVAVPRLPSTQATIRRLARSTASQSHTLRFLRPTNVHISSSSNASQRLRCAFFGRSRGNDGAGRCAFFYPLCNRVARHAGGPGDAAQRVAF